MSSGAQVVREFEWALYEMQGTDPSPADEWAAGGVAPARDDAEAEALRYLVQYASEGAGARIEIFEVTRKSLGGVARLSGAKARP